jgi:hypothetical protein
MGRAYLEQRRTNAMGTICMAGRNEMMKATHIDYLHPRHLRVEENGHVICMAPSCSDYGRLAKARLPKFGANASDFSLPRHSSTFQARVM